MNGRLSLATDATDSPLGARSVLAAAKAAEPPRTIAVYELYTTGRVGAREHSSYDTAR